MNVYCLFCLMGNLRLFLIYNFELINIGEWMAFGATMLVNGRVGPFLAMDMEFKSKVGQAWYEVADHLDREDVMSLLKIVLNNCVFSFQGKFYKQLHGATMGSPCLQVVANIYMEYFEKRTLGLELPISFTIDTWLRYVDDVLTVVKRGACDSLLNHLNSIDPNIKFTIEPPNDQGAIPFLDTFPRP